MIQWQINPQTGIPQPVHPAPNTALQPNPGAQILGQALPQLQPTLPAPYVVSSSAPQPSYAPQPTMPQQQLQTQPQQQLIQQSPATTPPATLQQQPAIGQPPPTLQQFGAQPWPAQPAAYSLPQAVPQVQAPQVLFPQPVIQYGQPAPQVQVIAPTPLAGQPNPVGQGVFAGMTADQIAAAAGVQTAGPLGGPAPDPRMVP